MIFVTVGTHEQSFDRLIDYMDKWAEEHDEEVVMQIGYSKKTPANCKWYKLIDHDEFIGYEKKARIVITHGGPCCFTEVLKNGKIPVVVPRMHKRGEHVDDHQVEITREYEKKYNNIIVVEDIEKLGEVIDNYEDIAKGKNYSCAKSNNENFCKELSEIVDHLFE